MNSSQQVGEWVRDEFIVSIDPARFDFEAMLRLLDTTHWAGGMPMDVLQRAVQNSLVFGLFTCDRQIGVARVITDYATYAYLTDVCIASEYRGRGLGQWMMELIMAHPNLQGLRRWSLITTDAHGLYLKVGFEPLARPHTYMEINYPDVYKKPSGNEPSE